MTARFLGSSDFEASDSSLTQAVTTPATPVRGRPSLRFKGIEAKVGRGGSVRLEMICGGDRGMTCGGIATLKNRKTVKLIGPGRKKVRSDGRKGKNTRKTIRKIRPGKLLARKALTLPAGDTSFRAFKLTRLGRTIFRKTRTVPSVIRLAARSGTDPSEPHRVKIVSKAKRRQR